MTPIETPHRGLRSRHDTGVFEKEELSNGITVWLQKSPVLLTEEGILVAYFRNVGNMLDQAGKEGVAHFLEHMPFKGTKRFPDNQVLTEAVKSVGGEMNAATSRFYTSYYVDIPGQDFPLAAEVLGELLLNPLMRKEDLETERGVIESERVRKFEHGKALSDHDVDTLLFGNHPAVTWGIGSAASIEAITHADIMAFWEEYYHAGNLHLVVGGTFAERPDVIEVLERVFSGMVHKPAQEMILPAIPVPAPDRRKIVDTRYGRDRFYVEWVIPGEPTEASLDALRLLTSAYSGGIDSPLAVELRDKRGLVYESGLMGGGRLANLATRVTLELPIPSDQFDEVFPHVMRLLDELTDDRIVTTLERRQMGRLSSFYYPTAVCTNLGGELVFRDRPHSLHEDEAESDDIDMDLVRWWKDYLVKTPPTIVETKAAESA